MEKKIKIISLFFGCLGLLSELSVSFLIQNYDGWNEFQRFLFSMLIDIRCIELNLFDLTYFSPFSDGIRFNYLNISFYLLLLLSVFIYHKTNYKGNKLLRFLYSIIMLSNITSVITIIHFYYFKDIVISESPIYIRFVGISFCIVYSLVAYYVLNFFKNNAKIDFESKQINNESKNIIILTNKWQRLFHLIFDLFCTVLLFSFLKEFEFIKSPIFNEPYMVLFLIIIIRTTYYIFYECLINTTPAKLLTGSTVINYNGSKPSNPKIIERTLLRFIPFETFSFLGKKGWHDSLSNTFVAKEKKD